MNLNRLRTFCQVVDAGSFRQAAVRLHLTQPAVSLQLSALSRDFGGIALIENIGRQWVPTEAGRILYEHAGRILDSVGQMERQMRELAELQQGHLVVGATLTIGAYILPPYLARFEQAYPPISLEVRIANTATIVQGILSGGMDLAFVEGKVDEKEIEVHPFLSDRLILATAAGHPLSFLPSVPVGELPNHPFLLREAGSGTRDLIEEALGTTFPLLRVRATMSSNEAILAGVEEGLGISILSEAVAGKALRSGRIGSTVLEGCNLTREIALVRHREKRLSPSAGALMGQVLADVPEGSVR